MAPPKDFDTPVGLPNTYVIAPDGHVAKAFLGPITSKDLDEVTSTGVSLMPDELERNISVHQMADLLGFLNGRAPAEIFAKGHCAETERADAQARTSERNVVIECHC